MRILVVEDEIDLLESVCEGLKIDGYAVDTAEDGISAYELASVNDYDLIILDLNLPKMDGIDVLKQIRNENKEVKILILSARSDIADRVKGLNLGANDYLVKPFYFEELEARIRSLLRRKFIQEDDILSIRGLKIDLTNKTVSFNNSNIALTKKEFSLLQYLSINRGKTISQEELLEHVWDSSVDPFSNVIRVHIASLRKKIKVYMGDDNFIENVIGQGYRIEVDRL